MFATSRGDRILMGAERRLYEDALAMLVDQFSDFDHDVGVAAFDNLQFGQKLVALYRSGRALLQDNEPIPERVAYLDAAVAAVYQHVMDLVQVELDYANADMTDDLIDDSWRRLVCETARESKHIREIPPASSLDKAAWEHVVECLMDEVLSDRDYEIEASLDADPVTGTVIKGLLGISPDYYTAIPLDPPDQQINLYLDALRGITPRGRGTFESDLADF